MFKTLLLILSTGLVHISAQASEHISCEQEIVYDLYLNGFYTGELQRQIKQQGNTLSFLTRSNMNILGISTTFYQTSTVNYEPQTKRYLTDHFHQVMTGFKNREMRVNITNDGQDALVDLNGEITQYHSSKLPLQDMDSITMQLQANIKKGKKHFYTLRQATDEMELFEYQVVGKEVLSSRYFGDIEVIKVVEIQDNNAIFWFAPSLDYLMIKATNTEGWILRGTTELKRYSGTCI
ncbi:DUF3108 domain-containing protein [Moritella sp. Urea-trap-13]|uniref:DUF3108 domain-containing protein n=1 Tax=Moritella sp. Urea-trap-13 TaxID=2058327 RepID=UPI000C33A7CC|nr:DUF3108 domain-containing protein [Moritella sp. Urea-trap-13]PKH04945.1 hypothetical protein CXF93_19250 [Moritella sp. Urea-trap-13]